LFLTIFAAMSVRCLATCQSVYFPAENPSPGQPQRAFRYRQTVSVYVRSFFFL
ncbi:hypothetical protein ACVWXL_000001, partial [Bradyrhizobium sp. GM22.5]